ncbi:hypothetical protein Taro_042599 [Colocasia esculenta]|uniref:Uncharacterized protein n=1 Tax=Colocasia esculenta TaxID=4460 RepID=A0A843WWX4_COLES|nr:hypothetical protein [Colocasia esculenta]
MLEPREADIPALFLFLVVLPLVTYILLGKWNDATKKNARISMLAQLAAEEALRVEAMATSDVISAGPSQKIGPYQCARCFGPATTRCSRCKSVRYCMVLELLEERTGNLGEKGGPVGSRGETFMGTVAAPHSGKCQIIHWRQGHKQECQQWQNDNCSRFGIQASMLESIHHRSFPDSSNAPFILNDIQEPMYQSISSEMLGDPNRDILPISALERNAHDKKFSHRRKRESSRDEEVNGCSVEEIDDNDASDGTPNSGTSYNDVPGKGPSRKSESGSDSSTISDEMHRRHNTNSPEHFHVPTPSKGGMCEQNKLAGQISSVFGPITSGDNPCSVTSDKITTKLCKAEMDSGQDKVGALDAELHSTNGTLNPCSSAERTAVTGGMKFKKPPYTIEPSKHLLQKSVMKGITENSCPGVERPVCMDKKSDVPEVSASAAARAQSNFGVSTTGDSRMVDARKLPKLPKRSSGIASDNLKKHKMLFPYEELVKYFQCEVRDAYPRGLLNCGNRCCWLGARDLWAWSASPADGVGGGVDGEAVRSLLQERWLQGNPWMVKKVHRDGLLAIGSSGEAVKEAGAAGVLLCGGLILKILPWSIERGTYPSPSKGELWVKLVGMPLLLCDEAGFAFLVCGFYKHIAQAGQQRRVALRELGFRGSQTQVEDKKCTAISISKCSAQESKSWPNAMVERGVEPGQALSMPGSGDGGISSLTMGCLCAMDRLELRLGPAGRMEACKCMSGSARR